MRSKYTLLMLCLAAVPSYSFTWGQRPPECPIGQPGDGYCHCMEERKNRIPIPGTAFCADNSNTPPGGVGCIQDNTCLEITTGREVYEDSPVQFPPNNLGITVKPSLW